MTSQTTSTLGTILELLDTLPSDMILSDGGTDWAVECLIAAIRAAEEPDTREYALGYTEDGMVTISELTATELKTPPAYVQRTED